ncbi:MAG: prepilin-type N-terminal cleavage/methylation domain-containing protein [bacterium]|nr:prepilin-type N-terminal cleavage/methylation domain-containing protein [Candidatus Sumerlaeota bacterium]
MKKAFTLIELLIVVAIIAILAAIAVPNFIEAQTRSKVSRAKADMRSVSTALESYMVDNNAYPNCHRYGIALADVSDPAGTRILERISTPVAYMSSALTKDPFKISFRLSAATAQGMRTASPLAVSPGTDSAATYNCYIYQSFNDFQRYTIPPDGFSLNTLPMASKAWIFHSCGPYSTYYNLGGVLSSDGPDQLMYALDMIYDPTNGTVSRGSIWRNGGATSSGSGSYKAGSALMAAIRTQR